MNEKRRNNLWLNVFDLLTTTGCFPQYRAQVAIIRATTADERGNLTYEHEGAYLGPLEQATAVRNNGGIIIAQVKRQVAAGSLKPKEVRIPGVLVDYIVIAPEQTQTAQTQYEPAISGEISRPLSAFRYMEHGPARVIASESRKNYKVEMR